MVEVNGGNAAPAGVSVWVQLSVDVVAATCGVQLNPMAGAFAPTVAGALIVRLAPAVIANAAVPAGIVQARATLAMVKPAVATVTAAVPVPPVKVTAGNALSVGGVGVSVVMFTVTGCPTQAPGILFPTSSEQLTLVNVIWETALAPADALIVIEPAKT